MYETFFGLKRRPFLFVPDVESYFPVDCMEEAHRTVQRTLQKGEGIALIFGAAGIGKTLLMRILRQSLASQPLESQYTVVFVSNSRLETPKALFLQLAHDLSLSPACGETIELRLQLLNFARQEATQGIILLFDEAQHLSPSVLEEIRLLTDSVEGLLPRFRVVLAGTMDFEEKLTLPNLEAFNQRVVSRCYLDAFSGEETARYIRRQTDELRNDPPHTHPAPLFTAEAQRQIHQLTGGIPRLINQLCGTALQCAADKGIQCVDGALLHDAWAHLQHIDSVDKTEKTNPSAAVETVISPEQIEKIVDQKRKTFQFRQFDSVEYGTLTDSDSELVEPESITVNRTFHGNGYKPPFPEDDDEEFAEEDAAVHRVPAQLPEMTVKIYVPSQTVPFPKRKLIPCWDKIRRKISRQYLLQKIRQQFDQYAKLLQNAESQRWVSCNNESDMNEKSLQEYGSAVLEGRPPFVRKEPHYAYRTAEAAQQHVPYPDPKTGVPITLCWLSENTEKTERFGVSYSEFLKREVPVDLPADSLPILVPPPQTEQTISAESVVRTSLSASLDHSIANPLCSGLEEIFEESHHVGDSAVSLAELFRTNSSALQRIEESAEFKNLDAVVQRQLEAVVKRLLQAAEKIERAAEVSEKAGQHVSQAAEFVESEVKSALPTYTELFQKLSDFHEIVSAELESTRNWSTEPPKFRTFPPRHQVVIERSVPTIGVESLLR